MSRHPTDEANFIVPAEDGTLRAVGLVFCNEITPHSEANDLDLIGSYCWLDSPVFPMTIEKLEMLVLLENIKPNTRIAIVVMPAGGGASPTVRANFFKIESDDQDSQGSGPICLYDVTFPSAGIYWVVVAEAESKLLLLRRLLPVRHRPDRPGTSRLQFLREM